MVMAAAVHNPHKVSRPAPTVGTYEQSRPNAYRRLYGRRWRRARRAYLAGNPLCIECLAAGETTLATQVDHIIPHCGDMRLFWDRENWQSLCDSHHTRKTRRETLAKRQGRGGVISTNDIAGDRVAHAHFFLAKNQNGSRCHAVQSHGT